MPDSQQIQPPAGFNLDAEKSREAEAAQSGITARDGDPIAEVGDPEAPAPDEDGSCEDDAAAPDGADPGAIPDC